MAVVHHTSTPYTSSSSQGLNKSIFPSLARLTTPSQNDGKNTLSPVLTTSPTFSHHMNALSPSHQQSIQGEFSSPESIQGFKDAVLNNPMLIERTLELQGKEMTWDGALKASQEVMKAFYIQVFKMLFAETKKQEKEEDNTYRSDMVNDLFAEQLGASLGKNVTSTHNRIAKSLMDRSKTKELTEKERFHRESQNDLNEKIDGGTAIHV